MKLGKTDTNSADFGLIGQGINVTGDIVFGDQLHIYGKAKGKLNSKGGTLVIGESGDVDADVDVGVCIVHGGFQGNVIARAKVEIRRSGKVNGDVATPVLLVEEGAVFNGVIRMTHEAAGPLLEQAKSSDSTPESQRQAKHA